MLPDSSYKPSPQAEALGTSLLPELRSPTYDAAFGDELRPQLRSYEGPPAQRDPLPADVLEKNALPLIAFVAPPVPPIAASARITGDVRPRLTVNPATGDVTQIDRLTDRSILSDAAVEVARSWKFDPARAPRAPVDVTVRFQLRCRQD
jgi:TonB family protein